MTEGVLAAVIGVFGSVLVAGLNAWWNRGSERAEGTVDLMLVKLIGPITILGVGFCLTTIVVLTLLSAGPLRRIERELYGKKLGDFPESSADVESVRALERLDGDVRSILAGAGPQEMEVDARRWRVGEVRYVDEWEWVEVAIPNDEREDLTFPETCGVEPLGELKILGFSERRVSALVEYTAPGSSEGTACNTGDLFFYQL